MPPYRLVIFDFDGTLADSLPWFRSVFPSLAERFGLPMLTPEEIEAMRGLSGREVMRRLRLRAWRLPAMARHMRAVKLAAAGSTPLFGGVPQLLAGLHERGVKVAIVSSDSEASVRAVLGEAAALVDHYGCGAALFGKAAKFRQVMRRAGVGPAGTLAVGDELRDFDAARAAGIACAGVAWGYTHAHALAAAGPDLMFATFPEMAARLLGEAPAPAQT